MSKEADLGYYTTNCLQGLRKTTKFFSRDSRPMRRDFNPGTSKQSTAANNSPRIKYDLMRI